jgi:hypothetical protein
MITKLLEELNISVLFSDNVLEIQFIDNDSNVEKANCNLTNMNYIRERNFLAPRPHVAFISVERNQPAIVLVLFIVSIIFDMQPATQVVILRNCLI